MKRTLTAADIKRLTIKVCGKIEKGLPYWMNAATAKDQAQTALAYLADDRYAVSPRTAQAIRNWAGSRMDVF